MARDFIFFFLHSLQVAVGGCELRCSDGKLLLNVFADTTNERKVRNNVVMTIASPAVAEISLVIYNSLNVDI
jgi:hypothetical protein